MSQRQRKSWPEMGRSFRRQKAAPAVPRANEPSEPKVAGSVLSRDRSPSGALGSAGFAESGLAEAALDWSFVAPATMDLLATVS